MWRYLELIVIEYVFNKIRGGGGGGVLKRKREEVKNNNNNDDQKKNKQKKKRRRWRWWRRCVFSHGMKPCYETLKVCSARKVFTLSYLPDCAYHLSTENGYLGIFLVVNKIFTDTRRRTFNSIVPVINHQDVFENDTFQVLFPGSL